MQYITKRQRLHLIFRRWEELEPFGSLYEAVDVLSEVFNDTERKIYDHNIRIWTSGYMPGMIREPEIAPMSFIVGLKHSPDIQDLHYFRYHKDILIISSLGAVGVYRLNIDDPSFIPDYEGKNPIFQKASQKGTLVFQ